MKKWTEKEIRFIRAKITGRSYAAVHELFNRHFCLNLTFRQVKYAVDTYTQGNGLNTRYAPGHPNFTNNVKGVHTSRRTEFKPGHKPYNSKPIGSESKTSRGFTMVKTAEPDVWRQKHEVIWEAANGPIPKGHIVIFADRNKSNFAIGNLLLVSSAEFMSMTILGLFVSDAELTRTGKAAADIRLLLAAYKSGGRKALKKRAAEIKAGGKA